MRKRKKQVRSWREHELLIEATAKALRLCGDLGYNHPSYDRIQKECDAEALAKLAAESSSAFSQEKGNE